MYVDISSLKTLENGELQIRWTGEKYNKNDKKLRFLTNSDLKVAYRGFDKKKNKWQFTGNSCLKEVTELVWTKIPT